VTAGRSHAQPTPDSPVALITGGTGALGSILLKEFRHAGYRLAVPVRSRSQLPQIPGDGLYSAAADLSKEDDVTGFVGDVLSRFGRIDLLLHAAGGFSGGEPLESTSVADWNRMLQVNLQTAFLTIRAVLPAMRAQGRGRIICLASQTGMVPAPRFAAYGVSKRALIALMEATAEELKGSGVTCNALAPGTILTQANREAMPGADIRTWVHPEDIAALCLFLASDAGTAVNGSTLRLPGGP
jgi:NAD(P)-dependent dehydrogenase (short-subunit alcohol dehydrogenase family)